MISPSHRRFHPCYRVGVLPGTARSPYGMAARCYLQQRLPIGREVTLDVTTTDRYGRSVAEVISGISIGLAMVEDGQAFVCRQYLSGRDPKEYLDTEFRASRHLYGVWQVQQLLGHTYLDSNGGGEACGSLR